MRTSLTGLCAPPTPCPPVHFPHLIQNDPPNLNRSCLSLAYPWRILFVMWMQVKFAMAYMALQTLSCLLPPVASHSVVHALCSSVHSWILATKALQVFSAADPFVKFFTCLVPLHAYARVHTSFFPNTVLPIDRVDYGITGISFITPIIMWLFYLYFYCLSALQIQIPWERGLWLVLFWSSVNKYLLNNWIYELFVWINECYSTEAL